MVKKNILMGAFLLVLILVLVSGTKIQSVDEYYLTHMEDITEDSETVTISIDVYKRQKLCTVVMRLQRKKNKKF